MTVPRKRMPACPIERCIAVMSGRWKAMILWRLLQQPLRYTELAAALPKMSERALTQALRELQTDGIIHRDQGQWAATALGAALKPSLSEMLAWGALHEASVSEQARPSR